MIKGLHELEKVTQTRPKILVCALSNLDVNSICRSYHATFLDDTITRYYSYDIEKKAGKGAARRAAELSFSDPEHSKTSSFLDELRMLKMTDDENGRQEVDQGKGQAESPSSGHCGACP